MKKALILCGLILTMSLSLFADRVPVETARKAAVNFLHNNGAKASQLTDLSKEAGFPNLYIFNADEGFVVMSADDCVQPILGYSLTGRFVTKDMPENISSWLQGYNDGIQYAIDHQTKASTETAKQWKDLENGNPNMAKAVSVVEPLIQTKWNQGAPYNNLCPSGTVTGCVATAMAQVMNYWNYPSHGIGSHTYIPVNNTALGEQFADFNATYYDWANMTNTYSGSSNSIEKQAVATLMYHCGVSVDMKYGPSSTGGSGASTADVATALQYYFNYSSDAQFLQRDDYVDDWIDMLKAELNLNRPIQYSGHGSGGGHSFICDGYDSDNYFHFNWGWSGKDDAWCPIGALNTTKYAFNDSNSFIGNIKPNTPDYYLRPENITDFEVVENEDLTGVSITWTNPANDLNGAPLTDFTVYVYRNEELVFQSEGVKGGTRMEITDTDLEQGHYIYSVIAGNEYGFNEKDNKTLLVGSKCDIVFELADEGGNGWKGASISVTDEKGDRIAVITMEEGSTKTVVMPLLSENLNFYWNHGWFHTDEQYDTDYECSFVIKNGDDEILYTSGELSDGLFLEYNNTCEDAVEEIESANNIHLYPNPTNGIVNIEAEGQMTISVINMLGQKILEMNATDNVTIDLSGNGSGIYMVRIETANGTMTEKVSIRK